MVKQIELHPGVPIYTKDDREPTMTRRSFNKKVIVAVGGLGVAGAAGLGVKRSLDNRAEPSYVPIDYAAASPAERAEAVSFLAIPDLQKANPNIHPKKFIGKTEEQITLESSVPRNSQTESDLGLAEYLVDTSVAESANYGWSKENLVDAAQQGYPIGQTQGDPLPYRDYLEPFMRSRLSGVFKYDYSNAEGVSNTTRLGDFFMNISDNFEYVIGNGGLGNAKGPQTTLERVSPLGAEGFDRSLLIEYSLKAPIITNVPRLEGAKGAYANGDYDLWMAVGVNEGDDDTYELALLDCGGEGTDQTIG